MWLTLEILKNKIISVNCYFTLKFWLIASRHLEISIKNVENKQNTNSNTSTSLILMFAIGFSIIMTILKLFLFFICFISLYWIVQWNVINIRNLKNKIFSMDSYSAQILINILYQADTYKSP